MRFHLLPLLCLPCVALAQSAVGRAAYTCDNGSRIEISFSSADDGRPLAVLHFSDAAITLPQVPAASGALYRNGSIRLHTIDDQALFEDGKGNSRRCTPGEPAPPAPAASNTPAAPSSFIDITGSVAYRLRTPLPPDAELIIGVHDRPRAGAPARLLAEQRIALAGRQAPIPFATSIDRDLLGKKPQVTLSARIDQAGRTLFASRKPYPALSHGEARHQEMQLQAVGRAPVR